MLKMFQRQLGAPQNGIARQSSTDLVASPSALSRGASRNNSFSRRAPAGLLGLPQSRSRTSLLVACSGNNGLHGDGSASDANTPNERQSLGQGEPKAQPPQQPEARADNGSSSMRAPDAPDAPQASTSPASASSSSPSRPPLNADQLQQSWDFSPEPYVPSPANLPTQEDDGPLLYPPRPPLWTWTSQPGMDMFRVSPKAWNRLRQVYVILFGVGERETEGIYSLRAFSSDGTPHETIIAFECEEEAQRYAGLLEASMDHQPHVCSIPPLELVSFCLDQTYSCRLEPKGSLLIPPDFNVAVTDWERSLRLRDGKFAVLDAEPDRRGLGGGAATATATAPPPAAAGPAAGGRPPHGGPSSSSHPHPHQGYSNLQEVGGGDPSTLARYSGLSHEELQQIRARLEALLPAS
ncbi:hypothetical protein PLESTB_000652800 [Pleodorina starrii]|uniref:Uncharacterized protein n=1 Tax=Pleodorina starrii TaxID=330485 RepID=A0A9W6BJ03_9CHLO|nr:hypothetical protein PLESTM_001327400 [Pleodorina starrii]GLC52645.1 hypothetical protein PLESTB_000652800 [Pleodorina starrii]GLC71653.1 hypothetical protein PLESTF_001145700 [Pleodorina starrii]